MNYLAWPLVVFILGIITIITFKKSIERLIDRTQKVSKSGLETSQTIQIIGDKHTLSKAEQLLKEFDNALIVKMEHEIVEWLEKAEVKSSDEREKVLIRYLAGLTVTALFEKVYSLIYGSQIGVLQFLNSAGSKGVEINFIQPWFEQAAAREPEWYSGDTPDRWLSFLEVYQLITKTNTNIVITLEGREFLKYIIHQGYSLYKRG